MTTRRTLLRQLTAAGLLASIPGLIRNALANGDKPVSPGLHKISGVVTVNGQAARTGMLIAPGDTVVTGPGSEAIYVVGQDAFLQRDNSTVSIGAEAARNTMRVLTGKLLSVFGKGEKLVQTKTATIGIRGTGCYIEAEEKRMYICLCYGVADYTPHIAPDKAQRVTTNHHEHPVWISGESASEPITTAPMINHTDAELTLLESLVGRMPPFAGKTDNRY